MDIVDEIRKGKYKTKIEYPNKRVLYQCKCKHTCSSSDKFCPECGNEMGNLVDKYAVAMKLYNKDVGRLCSKFMDDALKDVGLSKHEAKLRAYSMAWERGHSSGYEDVYYVLTEIAHVVLGD